LLPSFLQKRGVYRWLPELNTYNYKSYEINKMASYTFEFESKAVITADTSIYNGFYVCEMKLTGVEKPELCCISTNFGLQSEPRSYSSYCLKATREQLAEQICPVFIPKWDGFVLKTLKIMVHVPIACGGFPNIVLRSGTLTLPSCSEIKQH